nr:uncharacterized protein LOC111515690 [Leptinotarsa decemlineata]
MFTTATMLSSIVYLASCLIIPSEELVANNQGINVFMESTARQTRNAVIPDNIEDLLKPGVKKAFIHTHGDNVDDDGHILGFSKKMNSEGDDGYKHFDSFHKKNNNKYGFEIFSKFGRKETANIDTTDRDQENKEEDSGK